jgi:hypothetical protein
MPPEHGMVFTRSTCASYRYTRYADSNAMHRSGPADAVVSKTPVLHAT